MRNKASPIPDVRLICATDDSSAPEPPHTAGIDSRRPQACMEVNSACSLGWSGAQVVPSFIISIVACTAHTSAHNPSRLLSYCGC